MANPKPTKNKNAFPRFNMGGGAGFGLGGGQFKGKYRNFNNPIKSYDKVLASVGIKVPKGTKSALGKADRTAKSLERVQANLFGKKQSRRKRR
jgi:hypothetical protein